MLIDSGWHSDRYFRQEGIQGYAADWTVRRGNLLNVKTSWFLLLFAECFPTDRSEQ